MILKAVWVEDYDIVVNYSDTFEISLHDKKNNVN